MSKDSQPTLEFLAPTSPLAAIAWVGGLSAAIQNEEIVAQFRADTGNNWHPSRIPIERMIDDATGRDRVFIIDFVRWFNRNIWGEVNGRACNGDEEEYVINPES